MSEVESAFYIPREGDVITYETKHNVFPDRVVTTVKDYDGFTDVWFEGAPIDPRWPDRAPFNVNHSTGACNTSSTQGGRVRRSSASPQYTSATSATLGKVAETLADVFGERQYSFDGDSYPWRYAARAVTAYPTVLPDSFDVPAKISGELAENYIRAWADDLGVKVTDLAVVLANQWLEAEGIERP